MALMTEGHVVHMCLCKSQEAAHAHASRHSPRQHGDEVRSILVVEVHDRHALGGPNKAAGVQSALQKAELMRKVIGQLGGDGGQKV